MQYPEDYMDTIVLGDCLEVMKDILSGSVNAVITDLPYGRTRCKWDSIIPLDLLWKQVKRVLNKNGVFVTTAIQPFTSMLIMSNPSWFKYTLVVDKAKCSTPLNAKKQPLRIHEDIVVFGPSKVVYHPQMIPAKQRSFSNKIYYGGDAYGKSDKPRDFNNHGLAYPRSILYFPNTVQKGKQHPTQKPVSLYEWLILTYTNPDDLILDPCVGSGTTALAAQKTGRHFIGIEKDEKYCEVARSRVGQIRLSI